MRTHILAILLLFSFICPFHAQDSNTIKQDYHLIYIELSSNNNRMGLVNELNSLYGFLTSNGDLFVSYLSNAESGKLYPGNDQSDELFFLIGDLNTSLPDVDFDLRKIISYWNEHDITYLDMEDVTHHLYQSLIIHFFVSPSFYNISGESFASKLLDINNLNDLKGNTGRVKQIFHFNALDTDDEFLSLIERKYEEGFEKSVDRIFITY